MNVAPHSAAMNVAPNSSASMNLAPSTTSATVSAAAAGVGESSTKRWTMDHAASYLQFTATTSHDALSTSKTTSTPGSQYFYKNHPYKKRVNPIGANKLSSSASPSSSSSPAPPRAWKESDFVVDAMLGEGHFGKIYRAYCYPRTLSSSSSSTPRSSRWSNGCDPAAAPKMMTKMKSSSMAADAATNTNTVALKRFSRDRIANSQQQGTRLVELLQREINIHSNLKHPYILSFLGHYIDHANLTLILEHAAFGDLYGYMNFADQQVDNTASLGTLLQRRLETARVVMAQMTSAVAHLQTVRVAHRDIKPENVLVVETRTVPCRVSSSTTSVPTVFKLCDFGWAVSYQGFIAGRLSTLCGTPEYVPPEMLGPNRFYRGEFVDPWALGVLAYELVIGDSPFHVDDDEADDEHHDAFGSAFSHDNVMDTGHRKTIVDRIFDKIRSFSEIEIPMSGDESVDDVAFLDLVQGFLQVEPMHRRLAGDCLDHPFFAAKDSSSSTNQGHDASDWQKDNNHMHETTPTVAQRCQLWSEQKHFEPWPGQEDEI